MMGYSRDSFYRFKELYNAGGELALQELTRRKPVLKNRIAPQIETVLIELSLAWRRPRGIPRISIDRDRRSAIARRREPPGLDRSR